MAGYGGAGKDTVCEILCQEYGFTLFSTSEILRAITKHIYQIEITENPVRTQLFETANFLRTVIDSSALVKLCIFQAQQLDKTKILISGMRSTGEADAVKAAGGIVIGVTADPEVRYQRIHGRNRDKDATKTYEQFLAHDELENTGISDHGAGRGIASIIAEADIVIDNNGTLDELKNSVQRAISSCKSVLR